MIPPASILLALSLAPAGHAPAPGLSAVQAVQHTITLNDPAPVPPPPPVPPSGEPVPVPVPPPAPPHPPGHDCPGCGLG